MDICTETNVILFNCTGYFRAVFKAIMIICYDLKLVCMSATSLHVKAAGLFRVWSEGLMLGSGLDSHKSILKSSYMNSLQSFYIFYGVLPRSTCEINPIDL